MQTLERRHSPRFRLNYPVIICSSRAIANVAGYHYGRIIDAGRDGIRLRLDNFGDMTTGTVLQLVCQPARGHLPDNRCMPVGIQGKVIWLDRPENQFGLRYTL